MSLNKWFEECSAAQFQHLVETPLKTTTLLQAMEKRHLEFVENQDRILQESARESETVFQEFKETLLHNFGVHYDKIDFNRLREENEKLRKQDEMDEQREKAAVNKRKGKKAAMHKPTAAHNNYLTKRTYKQVREEVQQNAASSKLSSAKH